EHVVIGRPAAIKVLHAEWSCSLDAVARFQREALSVNSIGHPSIIDIYEIGELPDGRPFLVMELLEGKDLESHIRARKRLVPGEVLDVLTPLCEALAAAHQQSIVHRDVKAANVFLDQRRVVLLDFGVAKLLDDQGADFTTSHHFLGTPGVMAPEQAEGGP